MPAPRPGHLRVSRHAHWMEIGAPPGHAAELWIVLHGYGQRADRFLRRFTALAGPDRRIVAPEGLSRFYLDDRYERVGASWMTREDREHEIEDTVLWLDALAAHLRERDGAPTRCVVVGFSQGAPAAGRWLALGHTRADRLICWGAGLPHDLDAALQRERFSMIDLTLVRGDSDSLVAPERIDAEADRLQAIGIPFRLVHYSGGHDIDAATLVALAQE